MSNKNTSYVFKKVGRQEGWKKCLCSLSSRFPYTQPIETKQKANIETCLMLLYFGQF